MLPDEQPVEYILEGMDAVMAGTAQPKVILFDIGGVVVSPSDSCNSPAVFLPTSFTHVPWQILSRYSLQLLYYLLQVAWTGIFSWISWRRLDKKYVARDPDIRFNLEP